MYVLKSEYSNTVTVEAACVKNFTNIENRIIISNVLLFLDYCLFKPTSCSCMMYELTSVKTGELCGSF